MFTEKDVEYVLKFSEMVGRRNPKNHFSNLNRIKVNVDTTEVDGDTLLLDGAYIQCSSALLPGIVPRNGKLFTVYVPCVIPGSYWEPDDYDFKEIGTAKNLSDALNLLYLYSEEEFLHDAAGCLLYELNQEQSQEQP